jgi:hypothetical protein
MLRIVLCIAALGMVGCGGQQGIAGDPNQGGSDTMTQETKAAADQSCAPAPGASPGRAVAAPTSADLSALGRAVGPALDAAKAAAAGTRRWDAAEDGSAGATYDVRSYRLGPGACVSELEQMAVAMLAPQPAGSAPSAAVRQIAGADATEIGASFDAWVRSGPEEDRAAADLAEQIAGFTAAHADLQAYVVRGGGATARNAGVAIVDPRSRETVWLFARAVRLTTDRRT